MALATNSYGDTGEVAALTPRYAIGGVFTASSKPTLLQVESLMDQVSAIVNMKLSSLGFAIPVTQTDVKLALDYFVNQEMASIAEGINGSGRFGPTAKTAGSRWSVIMSDVDEMLEGMQFGIEALGVTRSTSLSVGYLSTDNSGDAVHPLFQVEAFGNSPKDWDS